MDISLKTASVSERRGLVYCNLSLRPLFRKVDMEKTITYYPHMSEISVDGRNMTFIKVSVTRIFLNPFHTNRNFLVIIAYS